MAQLQRFAPVVDGGEGQFWGKDVDIIEIDLNTTVGANLASSTSAEGGLAAVIRQINQTSSIEMLGQVGVAKSLTGNTFSSGNGLRAILTGRGATTAANLQADIVALGSGNAGWYVPFDGTPNLFVGNVTVAVVTSLF